MLAPLSMKTAWLLKYHLLYLDLISQVSFLQLKLGMSLFHLKTPYIAQCPQVVWPTKVYLCLYYFTEMLWWWMTSVMNNTCKGLSIPSCWACSISANHPFMGFIHYSTLNFSKVLFFSLFHALPEESHVSGWNKINFESLLSDSHHSPDFGFPGLYFQQCPKLTWQNRNSWGLFSQKFFSLHVLHELIIIYLTHQVLSGLNYVSLLYSWFWCISQIQILFLYVDI